MAQIDTGETAATLKAEYLEVKACLQAIRLTGASVGRLGLNLTRANIGDLESQLMRIRRDLVKLSEEGPVNVFDYTNSTGGGSNKEADWHSNVWA